MHRSLRSAVRGRLAPLMAIHSGAGRTGSLRTSYNLSPSAPQVSIREEALPRSGGTDRVSPRGYGIASRSSSPASPVANRCIVSTPSPPRQSPALQGAVLRLGHYRGGRGVISPLRVSAGGASSGNGP